MGQFEKTTDTNEETTVIMDAVYATIRKMLYSLGNFEIYRALHQKPVVVSSSVVVKNIAQPSISENTIAEAAVATAEDTTQPELPAASEAVSNGINTVVPNDAGAQPVIPMGDSDSDSDLHPY